MNTKLSFNIDELKQINSSVSDSRSSIKNNFTKMQDCLGELKGNITGTQINNLISTISDNLNAIDAKMSGSFEQLTSFLSSQMSAYANTYETAAASLRKALNYIDTNLK